MSAAAKMQEDERRVVSESEMMRAIDRFINSPFVQGNPFDQGQQPASTIPQSLKDQLVTWGRGTIAPYLFGDTVEAPAPTMPTGYEDGDGRPLTGELRVTPLNPDGSIAGESQTVLVDQADYASSLIPPEMTSISGCLPICFQHQRNFPPAKHAKGAELACVGCKRTYRSEHKRPPRQPAYRCYECGTEIPKGPKQKKKWTWVEVK